MPLNMVVGNKGKGKTSFLVLQAQMAYFDRGEQLRLNSGELVSKLNKEYGYSLTPPKEPPIFTSPKLRVKFIIGWYKYFEPYIANPYYIGTNDGSDKPIMFLPPGSIFFMPEFQRVTNSRKSATFPDRLSQWFEESRHWDIEFWADGQRGHLMDLNYRAIVDKIYEMQGVENELDQIGRVCKTTWHCREFNSLSDYDAYVKKTARSYEETTYIYEGNIFECYDSKQGREDFVPPKGVDFKYLKPLSKAQIAALPPAEAALYLMDEPEWFRGKSE